MQRTQSFGSKFWIVVFSDFFYLSFLGASDSIYEVLALPDRRSSPKFSLKEIQSTVPASALHTRDTSHGVPFCHYLKTQVLKGVRIEFLQPLV